MKKFNCTTPFGIDKTSICEDPETAIKALNLYEEFEFANNGQFLDPCNYLKFKVTPQDQSELTEEDSHFEAELQFESHVKKLKSFELYDFESLIVEIGGWVGLFLGVSIFQLTSYVSNGLQSLKMKMQN